MHKSLAEAYQVHGYAGIFSCHAGIFCYASYSEKRKFQGRKSKESLIYPNKSHKKKSVPRHFSRFCTSRVMF